MTDCQFYFFTNQSIDMMFLFLLLWHRSMTDCQSCFFTNQSIDIILLFCYCGIQDGVIHSLKLRYLHKLSTCFTYRKYIFMK